MNTITLEGVKYEILDEKPVLARGYEDRTTIYLKRPKGFIFYIATRYPNGNVSKVTSMGGWGAFKK